MKRVARGARPAFLGLLAILIAGAVAVPPVAAQGEAPGPAITAAGKLDLNRASLEEILALPIPPDVARAIHDYRTYVRYFSSIYDLRDVAGVTPQILARLKPLVVTLPPPEQDQAIQRLSASYRQARRYLGQEGASEGLVDEYLDMLVDPVDVNDLDLFDLMSFQNVSPVDATNILQARERLGRIESDRQLRRSEGVRYYAYRNLRDFVVYDRADLLGDRVRANYQLRYYDTPHYVGDDEVVNATVIDLPLGNPSMTHKLRLDLTRDVKAGALTHRNLGEKHWDETVKGFASVSNKDLGPFHLKNLTVGNFRVALGQGLLMDNTDFLQFRKTGFGWNKRPLGIRGDLSRSQEYALRGLGLEGRIGNLHVTLFGSNDEKDVILNPDGSANRMLVMNPRPQESALANRYTVSGDRTGLTRNGLEENLLGGNLKYLLGPGTFVGVTALEMRYDRGFNPDIETLVAPDNLDLVEARDSEIRQAYRSIFDDPVAGVRRTYKYRRLYGAEFQTVVRNVALQGEYGWLQDPRHSFGHGPNPDAFIINGFAQWDNLHILGIYRDYDVGFDNPYQRSFSNDRRYEMTLLDSPFRLEDNLYGWLAVENPQPKSERGMFFDLRYRISRQLTLTGLQYDQWERKSDGADLMRATIKAEYQPIFNLRFRTRYRYSSRSEAMPTDVRRYDGWEARWQLIALLSNYNRLQLTYMTSNVNFSPRPRLSYPAAPGTGASAVAQAASPAHFFEVRYDHNVTPWLQLTLASTVYDGFLWNFEGNEFVLLDDTAFRNWFKIESRISPRMLLQLKVTRDHGLPGTYVDVRAFGAQPDPGQPGSADPDANYVPRDDTFVRLQVDYSF